MGKGRDEGNEIHVTDIEAIKDNVVQAVEEFARRYISLPRFTLGCEVMDQRQLRDAMGLRATVEYGDPWPRAEQELLNHKFRWHQIGGSRVMCLKEREDYAADDGWNDGEEIPEEED